jgi:hypothetical protein
MKATFLQLEFIENIKKNFNIEYIDYGFYSDGSISVLCKDSFSEFSITVYANGKTIK